MSDASPAYDGTGAANPPGSLPAAAGSAAGPGVGSAAGAGPPAIKLRLRQDSQNQDLFFFEPLDTISSTAAAASPGVSSRFFLDPEGRHIDELRDWLRLAEDLYREGQPILPLFINGQTKNGKSYMLNEVLPAVANTYYCSGGGGGRQQHGGMAVLSEPNFVRVNCFVCERSSGSGGFLRDFLLKLKESAADQQLSAAASTPIPGNRSADAVADAIQDYLRRLPRDRLNFLLIDEAHCFYLMERPVSDGCLWRGATLDMNAVLHMRIILKELLLDSPPWVAWAVTGSSMATVWANVAATPTNGVALIMRHRRLNLSPTASKAVLQVAWEQLKTRRVATWDRALPDDLVWRSPPQIATLAHLCEEWTCTREASTASELVEQFMAQKLIPQVQADLGVVLQLLGQPAAQLLLLRELDPLSGVESAKLPLAFKVLLASFATERDEGRLHLDYPLLAQVLQAITTESGELVDNYSTAVQRLISSKMCRELVVLGECCKDDKDFDSYGDLHSLLEDMASALALTPDGLLKADWFIQVLDHRCNSCGGKANFERNYGAQARQDVKVGLRWFHALLRDVLSHGSLLEQRQALQAYPSKLAEFHSSGRISEVVTKAYDGPVPGRSKARGASAAATPRAQLRPHAGPVGPIPLHVGKRLGRAAVVQPRYMGRM